MFATGLIVFRETLEAALFVGILAAATRSVPQSLRWLWLGVLGGALGSLGLALSMARMGHWAEGLGQEWVNAVILGAAWLMLAWHCIWVTPQAQSRAQAARQLGLASARQPSLWALSLAVALAVLREGAETVLFVAGLVSGSHQNAGAVLPSAGLGLLLGCSVGWLLFMGLGRVKPGGLFRVTQTLILLLAGSLASQLAKVLNQANVLPLLSEQAWDLSALLPDASAWGVLLHGVMGYEASPMQIQIVFEVGAMAVIVLMSCWVKGRIQRGRGWPGQVAHLARH